MRVGFSNMIQRPNAKVWNSVRRDHQGQRKHACPSQNWNSMGIVHKEWVPAGQTVNQYYYKDIFETQKESHTGSSKHCYKLDPSSRQCTSPCSVLCSAVFDIQRHYGDAAASLLTWSHALQILLISKSKIGSERTPFSINRRHPEVCNAGLNPYRTNVENKVSS